MTCYYKAFYQHSFGKDGEYSSKKRFALNPPKMEYVQALIDSSTKDGNPELTALLLDLSRKIKEGLIVYKDDPSDTREIGKEYDVVDNVRKDEDEDESNWDF